MLGRRLALIASALLVPSPALAKSQKLLLELCVNGSCYGSAFVVLQDEQILVDTDAAARAGLSLQRMPMIKLGRREFVDVRGAGDRGGHVDVDADHNRLTLTLPGKLFEGNTIDLSTRGQRLVPTTAPSAYLNYGFETGFSRSSASISFDAGISYGQALLRASPAWNSSLGFTRGLTRLEYDDTANDRRWTLGDQYAYSNDGLGGTSLIGGLGLARAFDLDPYLITYPQPTISGVLQAPGLVNVYENGILISQKQVQAGPFNLASLGLSTGASNVSVVVQDPFGGTSTLQQNFYTSTQLLRQGLSDYAYQVGLERVSSLAEDYGTGKPVVLAREDYGLTDTLTAGFRVETEGTLGSGGFNARMRLPLGVLSAGVSGSDGAHRQGFAGLLAYQFNSRFLSFGAGVQYDSRAFWRIGDDTLPGAFRPMQIDYADVSYSPFARLNLQVGAARTVYADESRQSNVTISAQANLPHGATFTLSFGREFDHPGHAGTQATCNLVVPFGRNSFGVSAGHTPNGGDEYGFSAQRSVPSDSGFGYAVNGEEGRNGFSGIGQAAYQSQFGLVQLTGQRLGGQTGGSTLVSGSLVAMEGHLFVARETTDGYALIETQGIAGVKITHENQPIGTTDSDGTLMVTNLLPYQTNKVGIDQSSVPMSDQIVETDQIVSVPRLGGTVVRFGVHRLHAARGALMLGSKPVQYGSGRIATRDGFVKTLIGLDGSFYFSDLPAGKFMLRARTGNGEVECPVTMSDSPRPLSDLGKIACRPSQHLP